MVQYKAINCTFTLKRAARSVDRHVLKLFEVMNLQVHPCNFCMRLISPLAFSHQHTIFHPPFQQWHILMTEKAEKTFKGLLVFEPQWAAGEMSACGLTEWMERRPPLSDSLYLEAPFFSRSTCALKWESLCLCGRDWRQGERSFFSVSCSCNLKLHLLNASVAHWHESGCWSWFRQAACVCLLT